MSNMKRLAEFCKERKVRTIRINQWLNGKVPTSSLSKKQKKVLEDFIIKGKR